MTTAFCSSALKELQERGFIYQCTNLEGLDEALHQGPLCFYMGFDVTATSLHVGHLIPLMMVRCLKRHGHHPIVLWGGATTKIGDPSGKNETRPLLTPEAIEANIAGLEKTMHPFFMSENLTRVNNEGWLGSVNYIDFLRQVGRHFSVARMLSFDTIRSRLENNLPLTFLEFNYMLMQAYDFQKLYETHECRLQLGGADQWANILCGVDLVRRVHGKEVFGLTCPLLTTASGAKMGKTAAGAIWLSSELLPPYDYWQFWRNVDDRDVVRFLKYFTELPLEEIHVWENVQGSQLNEAKIILADEATALIHGREVLSSIHETVEGVFKASREASLHHVPTLEISLERLRTSPTLVELMMELGLVPSKAQARRLIESGAVRINGEKYADVLGKIDEASFTGNQGECRIVVGKKHHGLIRYKNFMDQGKKGAY